ncbi:phytanoyl-CoA dioxygenase family protein [Xenorhabdus bovienii]|uniref:phytanoyl-CoA dioxygenase family protein n=1 Tax=Xenorhabdus bovienii TaxID=40576 RepID=UPI001EDF384C|nr:phytanoyl-CoA dioxygenase family protein [Xenorhabdus bovienii]MCG3461461.1 phytanoyl-CoA dioxygenase family protein [Xenorhabdus bovienii]MDE1473666.1 phytanoyl-CoA dioxygenase family protein [Xenorhabdus bovienii]MDE9434766.1 phytanoyl-CoA dioxygenase family protein [Xenorhabdus bovienii]MDE9440498.1 phytanoyl-CoA dioxygenase family protein [Xenorhabdus bovienii]MDE9459887.1 phytanoyl-CoA dioxygenase family protein [Xenorhabdus bovienii]
MSEFLSEEKMEQYLKSWDDNGYIVIESAVSREQTQKTVDAIFYFLEMDKNDPVNFYNTDIRSRSGIDEMGRIPFYHHQTLWDNRQSQIIYSVYERIFGIKELLVSIDRVNMNPPVNDDWKYEGFIHWDIDVSKRPLESKIQGLLSLTDDDGNSGGFQCVPGFHKVIYEWLSKQPEGYNSRFPDTTGMKIVSIPLKAGDYVIFHGALPHGNKPNISDKPRLAQYFCCFPRTDLTEQQIAERIAAYKQGLPTTSITGKPFPVKKINQQGTSSINLTELGELLLGS